jgi:putative membrane protein
MNHRLPTFILATTFSLAAAVTGAADRTLSAADQKFVAMVSQGGMFEVAAAKLAIDQGNTQDIRDQGTTEEHDHKLVGEKLVKIAKANGLELQDMLNPMFEKKLSDLKYLSGVAFDTAYLKDMEEIHAKDGAAFAMEAKTGDSPDLKYFAAETHRIVIRHIGELQASGARSF